jgi:magnesium chelatase family protein
VIAAAGGHHCCFFGPPGAGKSLLARAVHALLPAATGDELIEIAGMAALGRCEAQQSALCTGLAERPLRQPLTGISLGAVLGRARPFAAGEVSLAHGGILVLDEVGHHRPDVISALCLCLDRGWVELHAEGGPLRLPARAQIAATSNLCPCGRLGSPGGGCVCSSQAKAAFWRRLSAAFLDRIDMQVEVVGPELYDLQAPPLAGPHAQQLAECRAEVGRAWAIARARFGAPLRNATAGTEAELLLQQLTPAARGLLGELHHELCLSARGYLGVVRVARTIADLAGNALIGVGDVAEAAAYRARFRPRPS